MTRQLTGSRLGNIGASVIFDAFDVFHSQFKAVTRRAQERFEQRDWHGVQIDAAERLDLYRAAVDRAVTEIGQVLGDRVHDKLVWVSMKAVYSSLISRRDDWELAETFFNSTTRRIFATVGVDPSIEFVDTDFNTPPTQNQHAIYRTYPQPISIAALMETILSDYRFGVDYQDIRRDAQLAASKVEAHLTALDASPRIERAELIQPVFYRGQGAYVIGRMHSGSHAIPIVLALLNMPQGVVLDAVLLTENEVSILFSFTRSYFHVDIERPYDLIHFLKSIIPRKRTAELYIAIGYNKHGKTELYRDLLHHLAHSHDEFEIAPGERGMVMLVFTLPSYDVVFKIIKDRFDHPKTITRQEVQGKYHLVFKHDRAGRLVDAQEFEHLEFDHRRFSKTLLGELRRVAADSVTVNAQHVVIKHLYVERRLTPLNLFVREADTNAARAAVVDYGNALKDLAAAGIFPGDILLKNFGVTRHGRVVFYDYDELCLLTDCNFRSMPRPRDEAEEYAAEPWFFVGANDIFPEELRTFLGLQGVLREEFLRHHADLFDLNTWLGMQARLRNGEVIHIFPYPQYKRLATRQGSPGENQSQDRS